MKPTRGDIPMFSTVAGAQLDGTQMGAQYWNVNLVGSVNFVGGIISLLDSDLTDHKIFLEISPHPGLDKIQFNIISDFLTTCCSVVKKYF
jgi:acyl transferase domain-containing protein